MVKSKLLKQFRKKTDKADKVTDLLECIGEQDALSFTIQIDNESSSCDQTTDHDHFEIKDTSNRQQIDLKIESIAPPRHLSKDDFRQVTDLFETNMGDMYRNSSWALNMEAKRAELEHRKARYFIVRQDNHQGSDDDMVAFAHFRFEMDDEESPECVVLYVYEIQVTASFRKLGLGRRLMGLLEQVARANEMEKVMLTVFKSNQSAMNFYTQSLGYVVDENSPKFGDYNILSKVI